MTVRLAHGGGGHTAGAVELDPRNRMSDPHASMFELRFGSSGRRSVTCFPYPISLIVVLAFFGFGCWVSSKRMEELELTELTLGRSEEPMDR